MRCTSCGSDNPKGTKFCGECGIPFQPRCPQCGFENLPATKFCRQCGTLLKEQPSGSSSRDQSAEQALPVAPRATDPSTTEGERRQLMLSRLERSQVEAMIERVTGGKALPPPGVVQQIVAKTDGVPLFVEELTKTVVESGLLTTVDDHYELSGQH